MVRLDHKEVWTDYDYSELEEVQLLQEYLRIDTSAPAGDELGAARFLARELAEMGLEAEIIELGNQRANLIAILEGETSGALVLHHHIDVDPVPDPSVWTHPPFAGVIDGPWLHGRGVFDMKSVAIAQLQALREIAASGKRPRRSIVFLATSSEEVGSDLGMRWILQNRADLTDRFWAVLTEGGVVEARTIGDLKYWGVEFLQKRFVDVIVCAGSRTRLEELRSEMLSAPQPREEIELVPEIADFLRRYSGTRDYVTFERQFAEPERLLWDVEAYEGLPPYVRSMLRNEVFPFPVTEAEGGGYEMRIKLQILPHQDPLEARARLLPPWWTWGLSEVYFDEGGSSSGSSLVHPVFTGILDVLAREMPNAPSGPFFLPWSATDSRFVRAHGIPSYGFSPFLIFNTDTLKIGQPNERLGLWGYVQGVELYSEVVESLVN